MRGRVPFRFSPEARFELGLDIVAPERAARAVERAVVGRRSRSAGDSTGRAGVLLAHDLDRVRVVLRRAAAARRRTARTSAT